MPEGPSEDLILLRPDGVKLRAPQTSLKGIEFLVGALLTLFSMSQLVYHSIPPNLTFAQRKAMTKNDIFSTLNPTLGYDLETLVLPRTVKIFISTLVAHLRLEVEIQVMAMVLLDRLLTSAKYDPSMPFVLHHGNWKPVTLGVCMVACKAYDDKAVFNSDFLSCQAGLTASILTNIEKNILRLIDFRVSLSVSDYQRYWFELRHLQGVPTSMKAPVHISSSPETLRRSQITGSSISKLAPSKSEFLKEHLSEDDDDDDSSTFSSSEEDSDDSDDEEKRKQRDEYFSRLLSAIKSKQYIC